MNLKACLNLQLEITGLLFSSIEGVLKVEFRPQQNGKVLEGYASSLWTITKKDNPELLTKYVEGKRNFNLDELLEAMNSEGVLKEAASKLWALDNLTLESV